MKSWKTEAPIKLSTPKTKQRRVGVGPGDQLKRKNK